MGDLDATLGGPAANSYLSVAEADDWMDGFGQVEAWNALDADDKALLLRRGTRLVDAYSTWGERAIVGQRLSFPSLLFCSKAAPAIPDEVKDALCEFADFMLEDELVGLKKLQGEGVRTASILQQNASFDPDPSGLPAGAKRALENLIAKIAPRITNREVDGSSDLKSFFG